MSDLLLILPLLVPLAGALLCAVLAQRPGCQTGALLGTSLLNTAGCGVLLFTLHRGGLPLATALSGWPAPFGIVLVADQLSALMLTLCGGLALLCHLMLRAVPSDRDTRHTQPALLLLLQMGINGALLTGDLFNLYVWFEIILISSFVLLVMEGKRDQLEGGIKYVVLNLVASGLFLAACGLIYAKTGTLNLADLAQKLPELEQPKALVPAAGLLLAALGIKAGLFPLYFWLPAAYHTPAPALTALFGALLTKVGVYAMLRLGTLIFLPLELWQQPLLIWIAVATMAAGVLGAAAHFDLRRVLCFHIISQIGYLILGLALLSPAGLAAAIFYMIHNNFAKTNLLLASAVIEAREGTSHLKHLGGLYRAMPWFAGMFFISAFALAGLPPFSGFWAKLGVLKASFEAGEIAAGLLALAIGLLTLFSMTKLWTEAFLKPRPEDAPAPRQGLVGPVAIVACLTLGIVALSLGAGPVYAFCETTAEQLLDARPYLDAVLQP